MLINADLHIHSRYSGATSDRMTIAALSVEAPRKGINVLATGDCLHGAWQKEIKTCAVIDDGTFEMNGTRFILSAEVEDDHRVHHLLYFPSFSAVDAFKESIKTKSKNLETDGRPNVNMNGVELATLAKDIDGLIGPAHCVLPETLLHLKDGMEQIDKVQIGDEVLTHKGQYKKILNIYRREVNTHIITIQSRYFAAQTQLTSEHPIYGIKTNLFCYQDYGICKPTCKTQLNQKKRGRNCKKYYLNYKPEWIITKNLKVGDIIIYPIIKKTKDLKKLSLKKYIDSITDNHWKKKTPLKISISPEFCRLVGYFLSEGSCFRDGISFSLNKNEDELIKDIKKLMKKIFNMETFVRNDIRSKGYELKYYSRVLRNFFINMFYKNEKNIEKKAWEKQLPFSFLYLPKEKQFEIFIGWWKGDVGVTTSRKLMNQIKMICLRLGFVISFSRHKIEKAFIGKRAARITHDRWQGRLTVFDKKIEKKLETRNIYSLTKTDNRYGWMDNNYLYAPITKIKETLYHGFVFNLEVENDSSYVTESMTLHNCFTPWTAIYAYHNSFKDCYGDLAPYISFAELGLSADTDYADTIQELHRLTFLTNSDCHSPHPVRLAREFTRFEVGDATFTEIKKAILRTGGNKPVLNVGLPPQEGKYNESACISCFTHYTLDEAIKRRWKCSCGKRIKKGVRDRIREIATFREPQHPAHRPPYVHLIPLSEIITKALGQHTPFTQSVTKRWDELITVFGSEINVLLDADLDQVARVTVPAITTAIQAFRDHKVIIIPGGGGQYGTIELPDDDDPYIPVSLGPKNSQTSLLDY